MKSREFAILSFIIEYYVKTAEPVGSRVLSKISNIGISASTIRNIMSDLTDLGYIIQPHTSAGRIPTDKGYRYFVNHMLGFDSPETIAQFHEQTNLENIVHERLEDLLNETNSRLADYTQLTSFILSPKPKSLKLKRIEFLNINDQRVLVTIVAQSGMVINKMMQIKESLPQEFLNNVSQYLNQIFENSSVSDVRRKLLEVLKSERDNYNEYLAKAIRLGKKAFEFTSNGELFVAGLVNLLDCPDFDSPTQIQSLYRLVEDKTDLLSILNRSSQSSGTQVFIGGENENESLEDFSLILTHYGSSEAKLGSIGLIGPKRMDYSRNISIIRDTANVLTEKIKHFM